jgi:hypothetical protein
MMCIDVVMHAFCLLESTREIDPSLADTTSVGDPIRKDYRHPFIVDGPEEQFANGANAVERCGPARESSKQRDLVSIFFVMFVYDHDVKQGAKYSQRPTYLSLHSIRERSELSAYYILDCNS